MLKMIAQNLQWSFSPCFVKHYAISQPKKPGGIHRCSQTDAIFRFGSSNRRRRRLVLRLRRWITLGQQVGPNQKTESAIVSRMPGIMLAKTDGLPGPVIVNMFGKPADDSPGKLGYLAWFCSSSAALKSAVWSVASTFPSSSSTSNSASDSPRTV